MNRIFHEGIGKFVLVYLDDILVMFRSAEEHERHLRVVLGNLEKHKMRTKLSKCEFNKPELHFLGHVVSRDGFKTKTAVIRKWPIPWN